MANYMYVNMSGSSLTVYDSENTSTVIGSINCDEAFVVKSNGLLSYQVYIKDPNSQAVKLGILKKPVSASALTSITQYPYTTLTIDSNNYYIYKLRKNSNLYDNSANYIGVAKSGMFVACKDGLMGNSYPYLKHIDYVMNSSINTWEKIGTGNGGFIDSGIRTGCAESEIGIYGLWGYNVYEDLPEPKEIINGHYVNMSASLTVYDENGNIIGSIPFKNIYALKEKYESGKRLVHYSDESGTLKVGYTKSPSELQEKPLTDFAFEKRTIDGKSYYIFQMRRMTSIYDGAGSYWGKVGTYLLVACEDNKCGNSNSELKSVSYIQRSSDLTWVKVNSTNFNFGFIDSGISKAATIDNCYVIGSWYGEQYLDPANLGFIPYTVDHIPVDATGKRTGISLPNVKYITVHSTSNPAATAWNEREYLVNVENNSNAAFHIIVDEREAVEVFPLDEVAYHCSSTIGNAVSIGVEISEKENREKALANAVCIVSDLLRKYNLSYRDLRTHNDWNGKDCPRILINPSFRKNSHETWEWFISEVRKNMGEAEVGMHKDTDEHYSGKFKYNVHRALNISPEYLDAGMSSAKMREKIYYNITELKYLLRNQLTLRQLDAFDRTRTRLLSFSDEQLRGIHEFRFEGAGTYRAGNEENDRLNENRVTTKSIDFRLLDGPHYDIEENADYADGIGLYGAMSVVYRNGDILGVFFRASTLPDKIENHDTVKAGMYNFKCGQHPMNPAAGVTPYKALNLYTLDNSRTLPAEIDNVSPSGVSGVNAHKGYNTERGSEGCQTVASNEYDEYISLFENGEEGRFTIIRFVTMPSL